MIIAADVGGTKTVLQLLEKTDGGTRTLFERRYDDDAFAAFDDLYARFVADARAEASWKGDVEIAVLGVAGPVEDDRVRLTNRPWEIDGAELATRFGIGRVRLVNDFVAAASGIESLAPSDLVTLQRGEPVARAPQVVLGAGTGLGVAFRLWQAGRYEIVAGEGGNTGFAPTTPEQCELWRRLHAATGRVAIEQVVSGSGLTSIYAFLRERDAARESSGSAGALMRKDEPAAIVRLALEQRDPLAARALEVFMEAYGAVAGDFALSLLAHGGVFVAGGIAPRIVPALQRGPFIRAFDAKGRFADRMARIPVHVVTNVRLGLLGARALALQSERNLC